MRTTLTAALLTILTGGCGYLPSAFTGAAGSVTPAEPDPADNGDMTIDRTSLVLAPGEWEQVRATFTDAAGAPDPDGAIVDATTTLEDVRVDVHGTDVVRFTNEGAGTSSGTFRIHGMGSTFDVTRTGHVQTHDGSGGAIFRELSLTIERGRFDTENAELVAYRDANGYHAVAPTSLGRYHVPLDVSLPWTDVSIVCEADNEFLGKDFEHLILALPTSSNQSMTIECLSPLVELHSISGTVTGVPIGEAGRISAFESFTVASAIYSLSVPANGDTQLVGYTFSAPSRPTGFLQMLIGPAASMINLDFSTAVPAETHVEPVSGSATVTANVTMRTPVYFTTLPVGGLAVSSTAYEFSSTTLPFAARYGLDARNSDSGSYSGYLEITPDPDDLGAVALPDPQPALAPAAVAGPAFTFADGAERHWVELRPMFAGANTNRVRFFAESDEVLGFDYPAVVAGLQTLDGWDAAWEITTSVDYTVESIELSSGTNGRWMNGVSRPETSASCALTRYGWTGSL